MKNPTKFKDYVEDDESDKVDESDEVSEEERDTKSKQNLITDTSGVVEPGLMLMTAPPGLMLSLARAVVELQLRSGGNKIGLHFPKNTPVQSIYAGNGRRVSQAKAHAMAQKQIKSSSPQDFLSIGTREGFSLASDEGLCAVLPLIEKAKGRWVTFAQSADPKDATALVEALIRLRHAAKQAGCYLLLILVTSQKPEDLRLYDYCDDLLITATCDPDPGAQLAFSIDVFGLRDLNDMGIGKSMCSVRVHDGQYHWKWEPFIAADVLKRVIWKLRCSGKPLADIGKIVDCDKSTVHRHLVGLPPVVKREFKEGWLNPYADLIEIAVESDENPETDEEL